MWNEFKAFLLKQNALALAIGVVVGGALNTVVKGLVDGFVMPIVAALFATVGVDPTKWETATFPASGPLQFRYGLIFSALLNFVVIGFVAWRLSKIFVKDGPEPAVKTCPFCQKGDLDVNATRCPHCTAVLDATALPGVAAPAGALGGGAAVRA